MSEKYVLLNKKLANTHCTVASRTGSSTMECTNSRALSPVTSRVSGIIQSGNHKKDTQFISSGNQSMNALLSMNIVCIIHISTGSLAMSLRSGRKTRGSLSVQGLTFGHVLLHEHITHANVFLAVNLEPSDVELATGPGSRKRGTKNTNSYCMIFTVASRPKQTYTKSSSTCVKSLTKNSLYSGF